MFAYTGSYARITKISVYISYCCNAVLLADIETCRILQADGLYGMNARILKLVDDKCYRTVKRPSSIHYQMLWQKILILQYGFVSLKYFVCVLQILSQANMP